MVTVPLFLICAATAAEPPVIVVDRDNVEITTSCTVRIDRPWIADADGNGVIHITADGVTVDFGGQALHGAEQGTPDTFGGTGVWIKGNDITLRGARISGFKTGIHARLCRHDERHDPRGSGLGHAERHRARSREWRGRV
jgi:hypothetical protein